MGTGRGDRIPINKPSPIRVVTDRVHHAGHCAGGRRGVRGDSREMQGNINTEDALTADGGAGANAEEEGVGGRAQGCPHRVLHELEALPWGVGSMGVDGG